ncbi:hypothetical protein [Azospirillum palustre]
MKKRGLECSPHYPGKPGDVPVLTHRCCAKPERARADRLARRLLNGRA